MPNKIYVLNLVLTDNTETQAKINVLTVNLLVKLVHLNRNVNLVLKAISISKVNVLNNVFKVITETPTQMSADLVRVIVKLVLDNLNFVLLVKMVLIYSTSLVNQLALMDSLITMLILNVKNVKDV